MNSYYLPLIPIGILIVIAAFMAIFGGVDRRKNVK